MKLQEETKTSGDGLQYFYSLPQQVAQGSTNQTTAQPATALSNQVVITQGGQVALPFLPLKTIFLFSRFSVKLFAT